jgi:hypothetical protein
LLLTVAEPQGDWIAELQVPDEDIGFVLEARQRRDPPLNVFFELATEPGVLHEGRVADVASRVELTDGDRPAVRVTVEIGRGETLQPRPGATILARIHCGRRTLGYVWFHDLIREVRQWLWL